MKYIEVSGNSYQMGFQLGTYFQDFLKEQENRHLKKLQNPLIYALAKQLETKLQKEYPEGLDEIYGRADGANINRDAALLIFFPEIEKRIDGCTTVIMKNKQGQWLLSHNEDDYDYDANNIALVTYNYDDHSVTALTAAHKLAGSSYSYNSYGMIFTSNYIYDTKIELKNISRYVLVRKVIEAKSALEAIEILKNIKVASAFSLNILDLNTNEAYNVEKDIEDVYITKITERYARANHFTTKVVDDSLKPENSNFRDLKANELIKQLDKETVKISDLAKILTFSSADYVHSIFKDPQKYDNKTKSVTVANFNFDGATNKIFIHDYLSDENN